MFFSTILSFVIADFSRVLGSCLGLSMEINRESSSACRVRVVLSWRSSYPSIWLRFNVGIDVTLDAKSQSDLVYEQL